jgi:polar amino acid transport system substrate-binding protein
MSFKKTFTMYMSAFAVFAGLAFSTHAQSADADVQAARKLLPQRYRDSGVLAVSASTVYPPHSYLKTGSNEWIGYEIDLFNEIADILGVKAQYTQAPFQQLVAGVASGRADVALGDLGDNNLRQEQVDFIDHSALSFQISVSKDNPEKIHSVYDLCGRQLATIRGTTDVTKNALNKCESVGRKAPTYVAFPDETSKYQAVKSGRIPFIDLEQTDVARYLTANNISPEIEYINAPEFGNLYVGFIVNKRNKDLSDALLAALKIMFADGKYSSILAKWNLSDHAIPTPGIDIGSKASNWKQPKS